MHNVTFHFVDLANFSTLKLSYCNRPLLNCYYCTGKSQGKENLQQNVPHMVVKLLFMRKDIIFCNRLVYETMKIEPLENFPL